MKTISKVLLILVAAVCLFTVVPQNTVMAANNASSVIGEVKVTDPNSNLSDGLKKVIGKLLGFLQIASGLIAILMIAITGFNYIIGGADMKKEMKDKMLPIIVGLVLVFGAVSIAQFILGAVGG